MRIAVIGSRGIGSDYGGIERMLDELCPRLCRLGHEVDVFCRPDARPELQPGLRTIPVPAIPGKHLDNISRSVVSLVQAVGRYDIIHFHAVGPGILSALTRLAGQPSLVTIHGLDARRDKWGWAARGCLTAAEQTLVGCATGITVVSETLRRYFLERYDIRVTFIPNGVAQKPAVAPGAFLAAEGLAPQRYVLFASRLVPEKGCHDLIDAFARLRTDMRLVVAGGSGSPDYIAALRARADPARVIFVGHRTGAELAELFSNAFLFVLPSYIEGMSMALLEALAYGLPMLTSDIPENRAVLGGHGTYFAPRDIPGLARALQSLIETPGGAGAVALRLRALALPGWDAVAQRYDAVYRNLRHGSQVADAMLAGSGR